MAEVSGMILLRDATITIEDGTTPSPITLTVIATEGTMTFTNGGHNIVRQMNNAGEFTGAARLGEQAGTSTISLETKILSAGNHATVNALIDLTKPAKHGPTWVSTSGTIAAEMITVNIKVAVADLTDANSDTIKGATYDLDDCIIQAGASINMTRDGWRLSMTFESPEPYVTITQN